MNTQPTSDSCLNCGGPVSSHFCAACGQRNRDLRASLSHLISEMANEAFEFDSRIRQTLSPFLFHPGQLTKEYNAGRRMKYSSPLRIYLFASFLFFMAYSLRPVARAVRVNQTAARIEEATRRISALSVEGAAPSKLHNLDKMGWFGKRLREQTEKFLALDVEGRREMSLRIRAEFVNALPKMMFLLLPLFALILKGLYWRTFYVEHVVFAFHLHAFAFLALIPAVLIGSTWFTMTVIMLVLAYWLVATRNVYQDSWALTLLKFLLLAIPYGFFELVALSAASLASFFTA